MKRIFSGDASVKLWDRINGIKTIKGARDALYIMGCKLQELEETIYELSKVKSKKKR